MTKTAHCFARLLHGGLILSTSVSSLGFWLSLMAPYSKASLFLVLVTPGAGVIQQHLEFCFPEFDIKRVKYLIFIGVTYKTSTTEGSFGYFG